MTIRAVGAVTAKVIGERAFRTKLFSGSVSLSELLENREFSGLDRQDAEAILSGASLNNLKEFGSWVDSYTARRYPRTEKYPYRKESK